MAPRFRSGTTARGAVADTLPRRFELRRLAPSARSLLVAFALVLLGAGGYLAARETAVFAVREIEVRGAPPGVAAEVRAALEPLVGQSLLKIQRDDVQRRLGQLSIVAAASHDRAFPHTLRIFVRAEAPLAVLRRGAEAWLVSVGGRVVRPMPQPRLSSLPRIWLARGTSVTVGTALADEDAGRALRALAPIRGLPLFRRVRDVRADGELTLVLRSGFEVRLGNARNAPLKVAVAREILPQLTPPGYLDVSVPERPVAGANPQVDD
ncbi:MAG: cell division protein FtsQ/DivIB [Gaiellaceae bacterium]